MNDSAVADTIFLLPMLCYIDKGRSFNDESTIRRQPNSTGTSHVDSRGGTRGHARLGSHQGGEINSVISGKIKLHRKLRNDLENMKMMPESVEVVLGNVERESIKHKSMLLWLNRLKDAANDISDMLEDFEDETDFNLVCKIMSSW